MRTSLPPKATRRRRSFLVMGSLASLATVIGCHDFDTTRVGRPVGTIGEEVFGILCDRISAGTLREDLSGASFENICHKNAAGTFADAVDESKLPGRNPDIVRLDALVRHRARLIAAFDAMFPDEELDVVAGGDKSPASCDPGGRRKLGAEFAALLGRFGPLYKDGTLPEATRGLAAVLEAFEASPEAQAALVRIAGRDGYRRKEVALGLARPILAYPRLKEFASEALKLFSPDANPNNPTPKTTPAGERIWEAGSAREPFTQLLETLHREFKSSTVDPPPSRLAITLDGRTRREVLSRPRGNLEFARDLLFQVEPTFGKGPSEFVAVRDPRGFAALAGSSVPAPFVDADKDLLPDVDTFGRFVTTDGSSAPTPLATFDLTGGGPRDSFGRPLNGNTLVYKYLDASRTFLSKTLVDSRTLFDADPTKNREAALNFLGGLRILLGPESNLTKTYGGESFTYKGHSLDKAPIADFAYAIGQILADKTVDETLLMTSRLMKEGNAETARLVKEALDFKRVADKYPNAKNRNSGKSIFWDEMIDVLGRISKEPGLLEDVLRALGDPAFLNSKRALTSFMKYGDRISYNRDDINAPAFNLTTGKQEEMRTPVDRSKPDSGFTRSAWGRFIQGVHDVHGVTACNKPDAKIHASLGPVNVTLPPVGSYGECEVFKIENLASFYLRSVVGKSELYFRPSILRTGIVGIGAATVSLIEDSSGIQGFWDPGGAKVFRPKPQFLNRLVLFDLEGDNKNPKTKKFILDLSGPHIGTAVCPERTINDPVPDAPDAAPDKKVRGLRSCRDGDWLMDRDADSTFPWEQFDFFRSFTPLFSAFINRNQDELLIEVFEVIYRHWQSEKGTPNECDPNDKGSSRYCAQDGLSSYEPLLAEALNGEIFDALSGVVKTLDTMNLSRCTAYDANKICTASTAVDGITVLADATRSLFDPERNKTLTTRKGAKGTTRNDGTPIAQVTPIYLILEALSGMDKAFDEAKAADPKNIEVHQRWLSARSQLVDLFLAASGTPTTTYQFDNDGIPKITPKLVDLLRAQLFANCAGTFTGSQPCTWAKDTLVKKMLDGMKGPTFGSIVDLMARVSEDPNAKRELNAFTSYLLDQASTNDALATMVTGTSDLLQFLENDKDIVPILQVLATATKASEVGPNGATTNTGLVDANLRLLSRVASKAYNAEGQQLCGAEIDPNRVLNLALRHLVERLSVDGKNTTPLEVLIEAIGDIQRVDPTKSDRLAPADTVRVSKEVRDFLTNKERGLEQLYEIMKQGVK